MYKVTYCRFSDTDMHRIQRLALRVCKGSGARRVPPRAVLLRVLASQGLDLAETREITGDPSNRERSLIVFYRIASADFDRLPGLQKHLKESYPSSPKPALSSLQHALIGMALSEAETLASFPRFLRAVLTTESLKRGSLARSVGGDTIL